MDVVEMSCLPSRLVPETGFLEFTYQFLWSDGTTTTLELPDAEGNLSTIGCWSDFDLANFMTNEFENELRRALRDYSMGALGW